jgi:hypothetical protein
MFAGSLRARDPGSKPCSTDYRLSFCCANHTADRLFEKSLLSQGHQHPHTSSDHRLAVCSSWRSPPSFPPNLTVWHHFPAHERMAYCSLCQSTEAIRVAKLTTISYNAKGIYMELLMQKYSPSFKLVGVLLFLAAMAFMVFALTPNTLPTT